MGVKTPLMLEEVTPYLDVRTMRPTSDGVRDTVYILDDRYVLKRFEQSSPSSVREEVELLGLCASLPVPRVLTPVLEIRGKPALVYEKCRGESPRSASADEIAQIGAFLRDFHALTRGRRSTNPPLFSPERLYTLIEQTDHPPFRELFERLSPPLRDEGVIHGDLFLDNASFDGGSLSCVYDLSEACNGDFLFDLAVAALSWCPDDAGMEVLLESYGTAVSMESFREYLRYAGLYYSVTRFLAGRNFDDLWEKIQ